MTVMNSTHNQKNDGTPLVCPRCHGKPSPPRVYYATKSDGSCVSGVDASPCALCGGTGHVPPEKATAFARGAQMRRARLAIGESLMEAAKRMGITPAELSAREHGRELIAEAKPK